MHAFLKFGWSLLICGFHSPACGAFILTKELMHAILFWVGITLAVTGSLLYIRGPARYLNFENEYLGSYSRMVDAQEAEQIVWYSPGKFHLYGENLTVSALLNAPSLLEAELCLHVLNESQFDLWRERGYFQKSVVSQNVSNNERVSFELSEETVFHFVLENCLNMTVDADLWISIEGFFLRFDYREVPNNVLLIVVGIGLSFFCRRGVTGTVDRYLKSWSISKYRPLDDGQLDEEEKEFMLRGYADSKRVSKYFLLAFAAVLIFYFLDSAISAYSVVAHWNEPIRPEYTVLMFDYAFRNFLLAMFVVAPLVLGFVMLFMITIPRIDDLSEMIRVRVGFKRRTKKHFEISRSTYKRLVRKVVSWPFISFCGAFLILFFLFNYLGFGESYNFIYWGVAIAAVLGVWLGFLTWSSFYEACHALDVRKYATRRHIQMNFVQFTILGLLGVAFISPFILLSASEYWLLFSREALFSSVSMLGSKSFFKPYTGGLYVGLQAITVIYLAIFILGILYFALFPYVYKEGRKGVSIALISFVLTYLTELAFSAIFHQLDVMFQLLSLISPLFVALISWVAQSRFQNIIRKILR